MDYGTPFDRHTIIEDSHETKKKKKTTPKLEEPATVGWGLLRRLSKRDHSRGADGHHVRTSNLESRITFSSIAFIPVP